LRRITVQGWSGQKVSETSISTTKSWGLEASLKLLSTCLANSNTSTALSPTKRKRLGVVIHACHPSYMGGIDKRIMVQTLPVK
jgi:hypothetical protein